MACCAMVWSPKGAMAYPYCHDFAAMRRREGAMITQRAMGWRLGKLKLPHLNELMDMPKRLWLHCQGRRGKAVEELFK